MRNLCASVLAILGLLGLAQFAAAQAPVIGAGCADACPEKVCHRVPEMKTVVDRKYDDVCEDYCRPRCPGFFGHFGGGCDCANGDCGSVRTKKYLLIKISRHDEPASKCVVEVAAPACAAPCYGPAPVMAPPMPQPAPKVGAMMPNTVQAQQWPR